MNKNKMLKIDNKEVYFDDERNLLELIRKSNIELPTFCYHSEISIYGACRLCMVEVEGRGLLPACSTLPEPGLVIKTNTDEIRSMRKIIVELLLASHTNGCTTCQKGPSCQLQSLARKMGIKEVRFKKLEPNFAIDESSPSLVRDPNKCILCGDCVRVCEEIQGVGAIDFAFRGSHSKVQPSFGKDLDSVECVNCGQCARVCPTGALMPKSDINEVWKAIHNKDKYVVVQIAPAVRVAVGEAFGLAPGVSSTGQIVAALKTMGVNKVFDTSYTADMTIIEETNEFISRYQSGQRLPLFTSCCPAWVKYVEQYYPEYLKNLSSCKSPQQMFGSVCKGEISKNKKIDKKDIVMVSIMPCTAKKFEANRPEFKKDNVRDVDYVITTQELINMIEESGIKFSNVEPESFDMPFGFKTGAGVIFGNSGGVTEAVLRYAQEKITQVKTDNFEFKVARGDESIREAVVEIDGNNLSIAIVSGLSNAKKLLERISNGEVNYHFVEVMACPGGCIAGGGQPVSDNKDYVALRTKGIYENDRMQVLHKSQENPYVEEYYENVLVSPGSKKAHELLHTHYKSKKRILREGVSVLGNENAAYHIVICFGTGCMVRGSQELLKKILSYVKEKNMESEFDIKASFCFEKCDRGPVVKINNKVLENTTFEMVLEELNAVAKT